jgi:hypothetical protein
MRVLFWLYLVTFATLSVFGVLDSVSDGHSALLVLAEVAGSIVSIIGMLLYWWGRELPRLRAAWKFVLPLLILEFLVTNGSDLPMMMRDPERAVVVVTLVLLLAFVAPSFWMNARFAFGYRRIIRAPQSPADASVVRIWSPLTVGVFGLVIAYPCALAIAARNWLALGQRDRVWPHVIGAGVISLPLIALMILRPSWARFGAFGANIVAFSYLREKLRSDIAEFKNEHPSIEVRVRPWYTAFGWAVAGLGLLLVIGIALEVLLEEVGLVR